MHKNLYVHLDDGFSGVFYLFEAPMRSDAQYPPETIRVRRNLDSFLIRFPEADGFATDYFRQGQKLRIQTMPTNSAATDGLFIIQSGTRKSRYDVGFFELPYGSTICYAPVGSGLDCRSVDAPQPRADFLPIVEEYYAEIGRARGDYLEP